MKHIEEYTAWCFIKNVVPLKDRGKLKEIFDRIPAANVKPVVRGKWTNGCFYPTYEPRKDKRNGLQTAYCSNCGITQTVNTYKGKVQFNFCPYCGSDMRGN